MDDEKLVEAVRCFPSLWRPGSKSYKDTVAKENAWKEVATQVGEGVTPEDCLKKWRLMRDRFVRELKKIKSKKSKDPGSTYVPNWSLFDDLSFLTDTVRHRNTTLASFSSPATASSDEALAGDDGDLDESTRSMPTSQPLSLSETPRSIASNQPTPKKRKASKIDDVDEMIVRTLQGIEERRQEKRARQADDEAELFGRLVSSTLRRLSTKQQAVAKLKIQQVLTDIEFPDEPDSPPPLDQ